MITNLRTVTIFVEDQMKSLVFYRDKLGFEIRHLIPMGQYGDWIEMAPRGGETRIVLSPRASSKDWWMLRSSVVLGCENVDESHRELTGRGVTFTLAPMAIAGVKFAKFIDPDGNEFTLAGGE